jgi:hypothetical protein
MEACCEGGMIDTCRACLQDTDFVMLGDIYDVGPTGSTFDPYADITLAYDEQQIPAGITENDLRVAWCHGDEWIPLDSFVNSTANTVSAQITHLSAFTILAQPSPPPPAEFVLGNLDISPAEVGSGETVTVTVAVENTGGSEGVFPVSLWVDETLEATQYVTLAPGAAETVSFTLTRSAPGVYSVTAGDRSGSFTVRDAAAPSSSTTGDTPPRYDWWWLIIIAAVIIILAIMRRRRKRRGE